ncbi:hypothetical protein Tsubulata_042587 [Turnera subulata]|uniref:EamA domain-containing protein n=1 Tax=Turnera subulata TaxID=218843 RepID=A0A9Q0GFX3_9ROSI|nr:hypothetical protein Tsubulata_042587 [Turnera subulata]
MACKWPVTTISFLPASSPSSTKLSPSIFFSLRFSPCKRRSTLATFPSPLRYKICACNRAEGSVSSERNRSQKEQSLSFKAAVFGRKSLWRRVLFASKKVRSILLLNVITFVYDRLEKRIQKKAMIFLNFGVIRFREIDKDGILIKALLVFVILVASNIPVVKEVEAITDPAVFTLVRFAVSAIPFLPFVFKARGDVDTRNAGIELGFWVSLGYLMQALGLMTSDAGRASFISMLTIIVVPLLDGMFGAVVPRRTWFGALMSIVGVAMLESSGSPPSIGDLLNFLSAVFFGVHMLRTEHISRNTKQRNLLPILGYQVCVIAISSTMWYFVRGCLSGNQASQQSYWTWTMVWHWVATFPWIPALYTGVFSTALCLWIEMTAMRDVSATETAIIYGLEPVWGASFAWFLLGERWDTKGWIGAALVLAGSLTVQMLGSACPDSSTENEERHNKADQLLASNKQNGYTTSPVMVSRKKDIPDILNK